MIYTVMLTVDDITKITDTLTDAFCQEAFCNYEREFKFDYENGELNGWELNDAIDFAMTDGLVNKYGAAVQRLILLLINAISRMHLLPSTCYHDNFLKDRVTMDGQNRNAAARAVEYVDFNGQMDTLVSLLDAAGIQVIRLTGAGFDEPGGAEVQDEEIADLFAGELDHLHIGEDFSAERVFLKSAAHSRRYSYPLYNLRECLNELVSYVSVIECLIFKRTDGRRFTREETDELRKVMYVNGDMARFYYGISENYISYVSDDERYFLGFLTCDFTGFSEHPGAHCMDLTAALRMALHHNSGPGHRT